MFRLSRVTEHWPLASVLLVGGVLVFSNLDYGRIAVWDESLYGFVTRAMEIHDEYLLPVDGVGKFWGWYGKPPLVNWLIMLSTAVFGYTNVGLRFPFALLSLGILVLMYLWGRRSGDRATGVLFAALTALSQSFFVQGRTATIEIPLLFFNLLAWYLYAEHSRAGPWPAVGAGLALAAAILTKQVMVALALPSILLLELSRLRRDGVRCSLKRVAITAGVTIAGSGWWFVVAFRRVGWALWRSYFGHHVAKRLEKDDQVPLNAVYRDLRTTGPSASSPLLAVAGAALLWYQGRYRREAREAVLCFGGYFVASLLLFAFVSKRNLPWYYLHFVPSIAVGLGALLRAYLDVHVRQPWMRLAGLSALLITAAEALYASQMDVIEILMIAIALRVFAGWVVGQLPGTNEGLLGWVDVAAILALLGWHVAEHRSFRRPPGALDRIARLLFRRGIRRVSADASVPVDQVVSYHLGVGIAQPSDAKRPTGPRARVSRIDSGGGALRFGPYRVTIDGR